MKCYLEPLRPEAYYVFQSNSFTRQKFNSKFHINMYIQKDLKSQNNTA